MRGLTRRRARVAGVAVGGAVLVAVAALGAGALATPPASPGSSAGVQAPAVATAEDSAEASEHSGDSAGGAGRPETPPGQAKQKEARGNGLGPRSPVPVDCASARNHGEYVSGVARSTPPGPDKAATVAAAAQADCPAGFRDRPED